MTRWRVGTWLLAAGMCAGGFAQLPGVLVDREPVIRAVALDHDRAPEPLTVPVDSAWRAAPFRADRVLPRRRYDVLLDSQSVSNAVLGPPTWTLRGIVVGGEPFALFDGVAPNGTRLISVGDTVGGYVLEAIRGDTAFVAFDGAAWSYTLEAPWR